MCKPQSRRVSLGGRNLLVYACVIILGLLGLISNGCGVTREVRIESKPTGARVAIGGEQVGYTPFNKKFFWMETTSHRFVISAQDHEAKELFLSHGQAVMAPNPWSILVELPLVRREIPITVRSNIEGADIVIDKKKVGFTPQKFTFEFTRKDGRSPWSTFVIEVKKDGYRWKPAEGRVLPGETSSFSLNLTLEEAERIEKTKNGEIYVPLEVVQYLPSRVRKWVPSEAGIAVEEEVILSAVGKIETEPPVGEVTRVTDMRPEDAFAETRISIDRNGEVIYSIAYSVPSVSSCPFSNLWKQSGDRARVRLTDGQKTDLEATVSPDGQFVYFASDRINPGRVNLWRIQTNGRGGFTKITDSPSAVVDTEPSVSPDGKRIAFVSYLREMKAPSIWVSNADGTLPTQLRIGRSPSWSPDGNKIAFVAPDDRGYEQIWIMGADGANPTQLTTGECRHQYPCWVPDGKRIVYASNEAVNEEGVNNYDIWIMNVDGTNRVQLTVNGSYDSRPAVSPDGKFVYFVSNRGATKGFENSLQIWRFNLPP